MNGNYPENDALDEELNDSPEQDALENHDKELESSDLTEDSISEEYQIESDDTDDSIEETEPVATVSKPVVSTAKLPWYVIHTYSGFEQRAKLNLEERIKTHKMEDFFGSILVPEETVIELNKGVKKTTKRKFFPGYMLVQLELNEETWHLVKQTSKVTGFVGDSRHPSPLTEIEVQNLLQQMQGIGSKAKVKVSFTEGDSVKVTSGPFVDFTGVVDEVKPDKGKMRVLISIFGRNTPVELDFSQVEKV